MTSPMFPHYQTAQAPVHRLWKFVEGYGRFCGFQCSKTFQDVPSLLDRMVPAPKVALLSHGLLEADENVRSHSARMLLLYPILSHPSGRHLRCKNGVFRGEAVELHRGYRPHGDDRMVPRLAWVCLGARTCFTQRLGKIMKDSTSFFSRAM